jgi:hypothetical protein
VVLRLAAVGSPVWRSGSARFVWLAAHAGTATKVEANVAAAKVDMRFRIVRDLPPVLFVPVLFVPVLFVVWPAALIASGSAGR